MGQEAPCKVEFPQSIGHRKKYWKTGYGERVYLKICPTEVIYTQNSISHRDCPEQLPMPPVPAQSILPASGRCAIATTDLLIPANFPVNRLCSIRAFAVELEDCQNEK